MCYFGKSNIFLKRLFSLLAKGHSGGGASFVAFGEGHQGFSCSVAFSAGPHLATGINHKG